VFVFVFVHDPLLHSIFILVEIIKNDVVFMMECPLFGGS